MHLCTCISLPLIRVHGAYTVYCVDVCISLPLRHVQCYVDVLAYMYQASFDMCTSCVHFVDVLVYMYQSSLETHTLSIYCVDVLVYLLIYVYMVHVDLQKYITYVPVHSLQAKVSLICMYTCKSCTEWIQHETVPYLGSPVEVATK